MGTSRLITRLMIPPNRIIANKNKSKQIISILLYHLPMLLLNIVFDPDTVIKNNNLENMADYTQAYYTQYCKESFKTFI